MFSFASNQAIDAFALSGVRLRILVVGLGCALGRDLCGASRARLELHRLTRLKQKRNATGGNSSVSFAGADVEIQPVRRSKFFLGAVKLGDNSFGENLLIGCAPHHDDARAVDWKHVPEFEDIAQRSEE